MPSTGHNPRSATAAGCAYLRWRLGLSRPALADLMNDRGHDWTYETVRNIENDRRELSRREERDLRDVAGLEDTDFLLDGIGLTAAPVTVRYLFPAELTPSLEAAA